MRPKMIALTLVSACFLACGGSAQEPSAPQPEAGMPAGASGGEAASAADVRLQPPPSNDPDVVDRGGTGSKPPPDRLGGGVDADKDGIADAQDACPNVPEDKDGFEDADGCPDQGSPSSGGQDRDGDGLGDAKDKCPDEPEDMDGFEDADGCPEPDNDRDGIRDVDDQCPNDPETKNGFQDLDGCPDKK